MLLPVAQSVAADEYEREAQQHVDHVVGISPVEILNRRETQLYVGVTRGNAVWRVPLFGDGGVSKVAPLPWRRAAL